ncbi:hypothetical protein K437DRAFT_286703 [Tilletiaria anomala UBC 951]|uniref:Dopa 4,5-dioxygenase n=1 Tax=Tilletiaria anomala (strain ATCC 24038 / CBS 436.72 / UBC 951) TaxID=1037660 RepID=A0A066VZK1_TILAU|nr:uncharacterized protein K437DRAFT_286703 [Tilletiaria anomala UBC 951]KDN43955.1 hypothetical protein K437DRAFT_286703 [Tilletiaria anomala UBC 951]
MAALPLSAPRDHFLLSPSYAGNEPLSEVKAADGKSVVNPAFGRSVWYDAFQDPIDASRHGFDIHIYYPDYDESETDPSKLHPKTVHALALRERIRREFPELRCYRAWPKPVGPHPTAMFELNVFTPEQLGAIIPFLLANRGDLSVLLHPNTHDEIKDHTDFAVWFGHPVVLNIDLLLEPSAKRD